jgi:hypothetical protein
VAPESPEAKPPLSFGLEVATSGLASGPLQGGLLLGVASGRSSLLGVRFDYADTKTTLADASMSTTSWALGLSGRFAVAGRAGFDLALAGDALFVQSETSSNGSDTTAVSGSGFKLGFGPQLRYWIHPCFALGYLVQAIYTSVSLDNPDSSSESVEKAVTGFAGTFTLTVAL